MRCTSSVHTHYMKSILNYSKACMWCWRWVLGRRRYEAALLEQWVNKLKEVGAWWQGSTHHPDNAWLLRHINHHLDMSFGSEKRTEAHVIKVRGRAGTDPHVVMQSSWPRSQVGRSGRSLWNDPREKLCGQRERIESRESGDMGWIPALPPLARCKIACCSSCLFILCKPEGEGRGEADRQKGLRRLWPPGYCERWFLFYELIGPRYAISWRIKNKKQQLHLLSAQCHVRWSHTATYTHK